MILSASRRTDLPCCYGEWLMNRLRAGEVLTRNPMNPRQVSRIPLSPEWVDCIVFWTKDPENFMPNLAQLDGLGYRYCFQFTLTPYGPDLEPNLRAKKAIAETFVRLSQRIGRDRVLWRYDPVIVNERYDVVFHQREFERLCEKLSGFTPSVTLSFVDLYAKIHSPLVRVPSEQERAELAEFFACTAKKYRLMAKSCCEDGLSEYGITASGCLNREELERVCGSGLMLKRDRNQRTGCFCCESIDIGAYDTCTNGCVYCYANHGTARAACRAAEHDPFARTLTGPLPADAVITLRTVKSCKSGSQLSLPLSTERNESL